MKILVITDQFTGLYETFVINHITALIDDGHDVQILARRTPEEPKVHQSFKKYELLKKTWYFDLPKNHFVRLLAAPKAILSSHRSIGVIKELNPLRYGPGVLTLQTLFRSKDLPKQRFDIIHCHYGHIAWSCLGLKSIYHAPIITSFHGCDLVRFGKLGNILYWHLFRYGDGFVANSGYTQKRLEAMGCPSEKIEKIPVIALEKGVLPHRKILDSNVETILTVARLAEDKGIQFCLRAVKNLILQGYNLRYIIVGDGPYRENLEKMSGEIGLNDIVYFTGWLDPNEVLEHYQKADIFVLASYKREETQGLVLQEAQQHGLVVVGSNICGIPEGLNFGKAGFLFEPGNVTDLTNKIKYLVDNPEIARSISQAGRKYFLKNYSKDAIINKLNVFYKYCISNFIR